MRILNDIAYADNYNSENLKVTDIEIISELCMLVTFSNEEKKIFDLSELIKYPAYQQLKDYDFFKKAYVENGIIVWNNGNIDIAPETVYKNSYVYEQDLAI
mgnify:CR=1 FL=1